MPNLLLSNMLLSNFQQEGIEYVELIKKNNVNAKFDEFVILPISPDATSFFDFASLGSDKNS